MPSRQPRLPELQSVSHPQVFTIVIEASQSPPPHSSASTITPKFGTVWQLPPQIWYP